MATLTQINKAVELFNAGKIETAHATAVMVQNNGEAISVYSYDSALNVTFYQLYLIRHNGDLKPLTGKGQEGMTCGKLYDDSVILI